MASGLSDRVDCARLADDGVVLEREYPLSELPRLQESLADARGSVKARFAFAKMGDGRAGASVAVQADPQLICQRCLKGFEFKVAADSEIEFASSEADAPADSPREIYLMDNGAVSLRELAEEELLLALPLVAVCSTPPICGRAPEFEKKSRPFAALQDLLKKT
ncbi:MAG TPA: YceD family protein [Steroidobacteraceae bacterium]|nr:YceD family protein [Steroidobacteraceae bacterium]